MPKCQVDFLPHKRYKLKSRNAINESKNVGKMLVARLLPWDLLLTWNVSLLKNLMKQRNKIIHGFEGLGGFRRVNAPTMGRDWRILARTMTSGRKPIGCSEDTLTVTMPRVKMIIIVKINSRKRLMELAVDG